MRKILVMLAGILIAVLLGRSYLLAQERKGPRIEIRQESVDLGKVFEGNQVRQIFEIANVGDQTLIIEQLQPG